MIVVITHTSTPINFLHISGTEAVICFYVVSGYLIARVIRKVYKNNIIGFYKNRFLKVFPYYWIILFFSIICFIFIPTGHHNPLKLFSKLSLSNNFETVFYSILSNSTIMFADFSRILVLNNNLDLNFKSASTEGLSGAHNLILIPQS